MDGASQRGFTSRSVFVDAHPLSEKQLTGIGRYTARLALALARATGGAGKGPGRLRLAIHDHEIIPPPSLGWSHEQDLAAWARRVWRGHRLPLAERSVPSDSLAIFPALRPAARRFPFEVSVLHDFTPLIVPWTHTENCRGAFQRFFARDLLDCDAAVAVSHSTRADACWLCDFDPSRIVVAHSGPSLCVERHLHGSPVTRRPEVGLAVGTLEPRKNAPFLLDWFLTTEALPEGTELWWAGGVGWLTSLRALRRYGRARNQRRRVRFLGMVSDTQLCRLYQTAGWTAYPSLYEGFGFPVLDALRHGTPVLTSHHSSLRELDQPGVFYFDPHDASTVDEAWRALERAGGAAAVAPRELLDSRFDWDRVARVVLSLGVERPSTALAA